MTLRLCCQCSTAIFSKICFIKGNRALTLKKNVQNLALQVNPVLLSVLGL